MLALQVFGPGEVVGVATAILGRPRTATARAVSPASVLPMTLPELIEAEGGSGQPVAVVLTTLASKLGELVARLDAKGRYSGTRTIRRPRRRLSPQCCARICFASAATRPTAW